MELRNYTPHPLSVLDAAGAATAMPVFGPAPRLAVSRESLGDLGGFPVVRSTMGAPEGLPDPEPGVVFIVSALVAEAAPDRGDLAYPGEAVRDEAGRVVGCRGLCAGPGLAGRLRRG